MKLLNRKQKLDLDKTKTYLLACSGGPDSMALFDMLYKEGYKFDVAHVNYKSRNESDLEEELVKNYAHKCGVKCHVLEKKCSSAANFENEARKIRYNFFKNIILSENKYHALLVAHNADDHLETFAIQSKRKILPDCYGLNQTTTLYGFLVIRPLLRYEKSFLTSYCEKNKVSYSVDKSNFDEKYQRNFIRKNVISILTKEEKNKILNEISQKNKKLYKLVFSFEKYIEGSVATVFLKNIEVLQRFLFYFVKKQGNFLLSANYKNLINDILNNNFNKLYKFDKFYITFDSEGLFFSRSNPEKVTYRYSKEEFKKVGACNINEDVFIIPLKELDQISVNGHSKKVNRVFIDYKIPLSLRYVWPAVIDTNGNFVYTPRYRKNYKVTEKSKLIFDSKSLQNLNIL